MKSILLSLACAAMAAALSGCASSKKTPFDEPRLATVIEATTPDSGYDKVQMGISAGISGVLGGLQRHTEQGGTAHPASVGPAVGGLVDDARSAVSDSCTRLIVLEFQDDGKRARIQTRCDKALVAGQKVSVVRSKAAVDPRDILKIDAVQ